MCDETVSAAGLSHPYRYVFGDETGDPGFAFERGSTRYWGIVLLLLNEPEPLRQRVVELHAQLGIPMHVEFKFHKTSDGNRWMFLRALRSCSWVGRALVVDKMRLREDWRNLQDVGLYAASLVQLVARMPPGELGETIMVLDQFGTPQTMLRELRARLKLQVSGQVGRPFKKILVKRSRSESLIQCADMIAGSLMREVNDRDNRFFDLVRDKVTVWRS